MPDMPRARGATISVEPFEISLPRGTQLRNVFLWYGIGGLALAAFAVGDASLVRTYRDAALIEISAAGRLMLARRSARKVNNCPDQRPSCSADVLEAYETGTGKSLGQLISRGGFNFGLARFSNDHLVAAVEQDWKSNPVRIEWDPVSGRRSGRIDDRRRDGCHRERIGDWETAPGTSVGSSRPGSRYRRTRRWWPWRTASTAVQAATRTLGCIR